MRAKQNKLKIKTEMNPPNDQFYYNTKGNEEDCNRAFASTIPCPLKIHSSHSEMLEGNPLVSNSDDVFHC